MNALLDKTVIARIAGEQAANRKLDEAAARAVGARAMPEDGAGERRANERVKTAQLGALRLMTGEAKPSADAADAEEQRDSGDDSGKSGDRPDADDTGSAASFGTENPEPMRFRTEPPENRVDGVYARDPPETRPEDAAEVEPDAGREEPIDIDAAGADPPDDVRESTFDSETDHPEGDGRENADLPGIPPVWTLRSVLPRRPWRIAAGMCLVAAVLAVSYSALRIDDGGRQGRSSGSLDPPPNLDTTPGGPVQATSPDYQETLDDANEAGSRAALKSDRSFLLTPANIARPTANDADFGESRDPEPAVAEEVRQWEDAVPPPPDSVWTVSEDRAAQLNLPPIRTLDDPFLPPGGDTAAAAIENPVTGYLDALLDRPFPVMGGQVVAANGRDGDPAAQPPRPASAAPPPDAGGPAGVQGLRAGDMIYAEMLNTLNSDLPGPAFAVLVEGAHRGARLRGSFDPHLQGGGLALQFTELILPDGDSFAIEAFGLSPWTGQQLTRSRLEPRLLQRIGVPALAALLSGAASRAARPRRTIAVDGDSIIVERSGPDDRQIIASGVAAAAGAIGGILSGQTPSGPRILLEAGAPVVILYAGAGHSPPPDSTGLSSPAGALFDHLVRPPGLPPPSDPSIGIPLPALPSPLSILQGN